MGDKEMCTYFRQTHVGYCKLQLVRNKKCRVDCDKLSPESAKTFVEKITGTDKEICEEKNIGTDKVDVDDLIIDNKESKSEGDKFSVSAKKTPPSSASDLTTTALFLIALAFTFM